MYKILFFTTIPAFIRGDGENLVFSLLHLIAEEESRDNEEIAREIAGPTVICLKKEKKINIYFKEMIFTLSINNIQMFQNYFIIILKF